MSFDAKAFLESCIGNEENSLFSGVTDDGGNVYSIQFGRRFKTIQSNNDSCDLMSAWHPYARLLSFRILLSYEEFGLREIEEGVLLVDSMNSTIDQMTRFSTFHDTEERGKPTHWICAQVELIVIEEQEEEWSLLRRHLTHLLIHLVGEAEWHVRHSSKPRMRVVQGH